MDPQNPNNNRYIDSLTAETTTFIIEHGGDVVKMVERLNAFCTETNDKTAINAAIVREVRVLADRHQVGTDVVLAAMLSLVVYAASLPVAPPPLSAPDACSGRYHSGMMLAGTQSIDE